MWRPDNWLSAYEEGTYEAAAYEAGADAMLQAVGRELRRIYNDPAIPSDHATILAIVNCFRGGERNIYFCLCEKEERNDG